MFGDADWSDSNDVLSESTNGAERSVGAPSSRASGRFWFDDCGEMTDGVAGGVSAVKKNGREGTTPFDSR